MSLNAGKPLPRRIQRVQERKLSHAILVEKLCRAFVPEKDRNLYIRVVYLNHLRSQV